MAQSNNQTNQFPGPPQNYAPNPMNTQSQRQAPTAPFGGGNKQGAFNPRLFNAQAPVSHARAQPPAQQPRASGIAAAPYGTQRPPLNPQQQQHLQYQQRLMTQRIMNATRQPPQTTPQQLQVRQPTHQPQRQSQPQPQPQPQALPNAMTINAMSPQQRQQYILAQQRQVQRQRMNALSPNPNQAASHPPQTMQPMQPMRPMQHMQPMQPQRQPQPHPTQPIQQLQKPPFNLQTQPQMQPTHPQMQSMQAMQNPPFNAQQPQTQPSQQQKQLLQQHLLQQQQQQQQHQQPQTLSFNPYQKVNATGTPTNTATGTGTPTATGTATVPAPNPYTKIPPATTGTPTGSVNPYSKPAPNPYSKPAPNPYSKPAANPYSKPAPNPYSKPAPPVTATATATGTVNPYSKVPPTATTTATATATATPAATAAAAAAAAATPTSATAMNHTMHNPIYPELPNRKFIDVSTPQWNDSLRQIRVVSFNIMPKNAHFKNKLKRNDGLRGYRTRPNYYSWTKRGPLLIEEITKKGAPDIISLQGVDQFEYFQEKLSPRGYVGVYERTQQPLLEKSVYFGDGLAIFWKTEKFELSGRRKFLLGDRRYVSNIALLARLKRRSVFINPLDIRSTKRNIIYESRIVFEGESVWLVLSTKYLYLFKEKLSTNEAQTLPQPLKHFNLDLYHEITDTATATAKPTLPDTTASFILKPKEKSKTFLSNLSEATFTVTEDNASKIKSLWIKYIKSAQIGIEIDVWNTRLRSGHSLSAEFQRIKQCQVLFDCVARASAETCLGNKNIGSSSYHMLHAMTSSSSSASASASSALNGNMNTANSNGSTDLSERFRAMMEKRIQTKVKEIQKAKEDEQKTAQEEIAQEIEKETESAEEITKEKDSNATPTTLHRPVILCCDIESNAWGDAQYQIPPMCYTYLTMRSRTTQNNPLYAHSIHQLQSDPNYSKQSHSWFLQSAYALGFQQEPEFTTFNRYWPQHLEDASAADPESHHSIIEQMKNINFTESIELSKCSDLVLFSPQHFRVLKLLEPMNKPWIYSKWNKTLPNLDYPSDHTMIGVQFELAIPTQQSLLSSIGSIRTTPLAASSQPIASNTPVSVSATPTNTNVNIPSTGGSGAVAATASNVNTNALNANHVKNVTGSIATSALPNTANYTTAHAAHPPIQHPTQPQQQQPQQQTAAAATTTNPYQFSPFNPVFKQ